MTEASKKSLHCPNCGASVSDDCVRCTFCDSVLTITACPSCFGPVFKGMKYCSCCGAEVERTEVKSTKTLNCPRCENKLSHIQIAGVYFHECDNCGGLWLNSETFQKICDDKEQQEKTLLFPSSVMSTEIKPLPPTDRMYIPCPECGVLMARKNFARCSGVILDVCKDHGTWCDHKELQKVIEFIKSGGLSKARQIEIDRLKEEQKRLQNMKANQGSGFGYLSQEVNIRYDDDDKDKGLLDVIFHIGSSFLE